MANHPNRQRFSIEEIRAYLIERYDAEAALRGDETDEEQGGLYHGDDQEWVALGVMPNTNQTGWFYAGSTAEIVREMRQ